ncbi:hypothetical protein Nepgr_029648 [Nepenthes gracilis]|uniref:Uncharacterized protein n=1 Tax=Nepenthes gracilis TaxID=150966 RepID=A0AAD3TDZ1_NEPGR|nr:hypothetical protein Nepgr_029648 [Nepenthes gracilis]
MTQEAIPVNSAPQHGKEVSFQLSSLALELGHQYPNKYSIIQDLSRHSLHSPALDPIHRNSVSQFPAPGLGQPACLRIQDWHGTRERA